MTGTDVIIWTAVFGILSIAKDNIPRAINAVKEKNTASIKEISPGCDNSKKYEVLNEIKKEVKDYCVIIEGDTGFPEVYTSRGNCINPKDGESTGKYEDFYEKMSGKPDSEQKLEVKKLILKIKDRHDCFLNLMDYSIEDIY